MLLTTIHRYAAVGTLEIDVCRWRVPREHGHSSGLCDLRRLVVRVRAVGLLSHEGCATSDIRDWRICEGVE